jgi:hypothetical protein
VFAWTTGRFGVDVNYTSLFVLNTEISSLLGNSMNSP